MPIAQPNTRSMRIKTKIQYRMGFFAREKFITQDSSQDHRANPDQMGFQEKALHGQECAMRSSDCGVMEKITFPPGLYPLSELQSFIANPHLPNPDKAMTELPIACKFKFDRTIIHHAGFG